MVAILAKRVPLAEARKITLDHNNKYHFGWKIARSHHLEWQPNSAQLRYVVYCPECSSITQEDNNG